MHRNTEGVAGRLRLTHLRETLAAVLSEAAREEWTYLEFLDQIPRREMVVNQSKQIRMEMQIAHFPASRPSRGSISRSNLRRTSG